MSSNRFFDPCLPTGIIDNVNKDIKEEENVKNLDPYNQFTYNIKRVFDTISSESIDLLYRDFQNSSKMLDDATNAYLDRPDYYQNPQPNDIVSKYFSVKKTRRGLEKNQKTLGGPWEGVGSIKNAKIRGSPPVSSVYEKPSYKKRKTTVISSNTKAPSPEIDSQAERKNEWIRYIGTFNISCWCTRMVLSLRSIYADNTLVLSKPDHRATSKAVYIHHVPTETLNKRELGRLSEDAAEFIGPLIEKGIVEFRCKLFYVEGERLGTGDTFVIRVDCFIGEKAFRRSVEINSTEEQGANYEKSSFDVNKLKISQKANGDIEPETRIKSSMLRLFENLDLRIATREATREVNDANNSDQSFDLEIQEKLSGDEAVSDFKEGQEDELDDTGKKLTMNQVKDLYKSSESNFLQTSLPESYPPNFNIELRPYQRQGLSWMLQREKEFDLVGLNNPQVDEKSKTDIVEQLRIIEKSMNPLWREYKWPNIPERIESNFTAFIDNDEFYLNLYDGSCSLVKPMIKSSCNGGILADEMGLGKTITTLSLIFSNSKDLHYDPSTMKNYAYGTTLIVVPMALLIQWENEFKKCMKNTEYSCHIYYGSESSTDLKNLLLGPKPPTIVLTTYGMIQSEWSKASLSNKLSGIYSVKFLRVILDEGHNIRNKATKTAKAIYSIDSNRKWVLTGTPIINRLEDLYSLIHFLNLQPWSNYSLWKQCISLPFDTGKDIGTAMNLLKSILDPLLLRRTKNQKDQKGKYLVTLPSKEVTIEKLKFNRKEEAIYQWLKQKAVNSFNENFKSGLVFKNYSTILTQLLRLRQVCCNIDLIKNKDNDEDSVTLNGDFDQKNEQKKFSTRVDDEMLAVVNFIEENEEQQRFTIEELSKMKKEIYELYPKFDKVECSICTDPIELETCVITECKHCFCRSCLIEHFDYQKLHNKSERESEEEGDNKGCQTLEIEEAFCPMCRFQINKNRLIRTVPLRLTNREQVSSLTQISIDSSIREYIIRPFDSYGQSSKINALLCHLERIKIESPGEHIIVFSQFTSFLDIIYKELEKYEGEFETIKFDGRLTLDQRQEALSKFENKNNDKKLKILLLSLKAGGVGLNLTIASRAFLMDPHWNNAIEHQAIDRIHRVGQTKNVKVIRFIMEESIEERMLVIQKRKNQLGEALTLNDEERRKRRLEELQSLFKD